MHCRLTELVLAWALLSLAGCAGEPPASPPVAAEPEPPEIIHFYASPGSVTLGEETTLCYGVENADTVSLEPNLKAIKPGLNRCFSFAPKKTGVIKLTAVGRGGEAHEELALQVRSAGEKAEPEADASSELITAFAASQTAVPKGAPVTLCYAAEQAESVKINPPVMDLEPAARCFTTRIVQTTSFTITATRGDETSSRSLEVRVQ